MKIAACLRKLGAKALDISVRKHMLFYFLMLGLILIVSMTWFFTSKMMETAARKNLETTSNLVEYMGNMLGNRLDNAMRAADLTMQQETILDMMDITTYGKEYPMREQLKDEKEVTDFLTRLEYSNNLVRVRLLLHGAPIYINESIHFFPITDSVIEKYMENPFATHWLEEKEFPYIYKNARRRVTIR